MNASFRTIDIGNRRLAAQPRHSVGAAARRLKEIPAMRITYFYLLRNEPDRVRSVGPRHARYWQAAALPGYAGGPFADRTGGLVMFDCDTEEHARELVARDPFVVDGLVERSWLEEWLPE